LRSINFTIDTNEDTTDGDDYFSVGDFTIFTDLANIYNAYYKAKNHQNWDLEKFIEKKDLNVFTLYPLRVSGNH